METNFLSKSNFLFSNFLKTQLNFFVSLKVTEWDADVLEISRISRLDMGAYLCIAQNHVPPSVSKRIKVSVDCKYLIQKRPVHV